MAPEQAARIYIRENSILVWPVESKTRWLWLKIIHSIHGQKCDVCVGIAQREKNIKFQIRKMNSNEYSMQIGLYYIWKASAWFFEACCINLIVSCVLKLMQIQNQFFSLVILLHKSLEEEERRHTNGIKNWNHYLLLLATINSGQWCCCVPLKPVDSLSGASNCALTSKSTTKWTFITCYMLHMKLLLLLVYILHHLMGLLCCLVLSCGTSIERYSWSYE